MKPTYISRPIHTIDAPITSKPRLKFVYNFFTADERVNSDPPRLSKPASSLTPEDIRRKIPRYVAVSWGRSRLDPSRSNEIESSSDYLQRNAAVIADESSILNDVSLLYFQDIDHLSRLGERFEASARMRGVLSGSSTDIAAKLNALTADTTDGDLIQRYVSVASQSRSLFINEDTLVEPLDASAADQLTMIIDSEYSARAARQYGASPVASSAAGVRQNSIAMVRRASNRKSKMPLEDEIDLEIESVLDVKSDPRAEAGKVEHIGYMIERFTVADDDRAVEKRVFFISSPKINRYNDVEIQYGVQYLYSVRNVLAFHANTVRDNGETLNSRFLVASRPSTFSSVLTQEYVPPPPPADLNFLWDYQNAALQVNWAFPSNPQRDIKGWQVFRRKSLNEPFSLIAQLDFDDSVIKTPSAENVDAGLIKKFTSSVTFFIDPEFNKDSSYIYAVCSIDAHAMTSNYSTQYSVRFDRIQNKLMKTFVSQSGAAKQYPNTYLKAELSLDSVKSSNIENVRVYFDPEYLKVTDHFGRDLQILKTDKRNGKYRLMMLNTDRQLQSNVDIVLKDLRDLKSDTKSSSSQTDQKSL
jgi:hypothetical protein